MEKIKYITNKDLLAEIHRSKMTYCSIVKPEYGQFDAIVGSLDAITPEVIEQATLRRATREMNEEKQRQKDAGARNPVVAVASDIPVENLVFRVMTSEHIPIDESPRKTARGEKTPLRTNFPPFKHYVKTDAGFVEVLRSHWRGSFSNGHFDQEHGKMTNRLASMFMLLVDRYARRSNWRGYCVDDQTEALTQRGWLSVDEITEDDIILSYDNGRLVWSKIKSIYRDDKYDGKMFHLTARGLDALVTPGHKFVTEAGLKTVEMLCEKDQLVLIGAHAAGADEETYSDAFVELVGWAVTEGSNKNVRFILSKRECQQIEAVAPGRVLSMDFVLSLSAAQREILIQTMLSGDGYRTKQGHCGYSQKDKAHVDVFIALLTISGYRSSTKHHQIMSFGKATEIYATSVFSKLLNRATVENLNFHGGKRNGRSSIGKGKETHPNEPTVPYQGTVWCVETEFGSFMARRNGTVFLTGNSYVDEMRAYALLQLAQIGLKFDESKSDNPFAFFTTALKNSFTRILNLEKKNQSIRDDLLIMSGASPSYTRQTDDALAQQEMRDEK